MNAHQWRDVIEVINQRVGCSYRLVERLPGGRQGGGWTITDPLDAGELRVLKWTTNPSLVARRDQTGLIMTTLHDRGYPTPRWRHWGTFGRDEHDPATTSAFAITDHVAGAAATWSTVSVDDLIRAVEVQADVAGPSDDSWSHYLRWALTASDGPRAALTALGPAIQPFAAYIDGVAQSVAGCKLPTSDAVHGDLELSNVILENAKPRSAVIAIIDTDAAGPGTRAIDYAWLYRDARSHGATAAASTLREAGLAVAGPVVWRACLALASLELVAFVARRGPGSQALTQAALVMPLLEEGA